MSAAAKVLDLRPRQWTDRIGHYTVTVIDSGADFAWTISEHIRGGGTMNRGYGAAESLEAAAAAVREKLAECAAKPAPPERLGAFTRASTEGEPEKWTAHVDGLDLVVTERSGSSWGWTLRVPHTGGWGSDDDGISGLRGGRDLAMASAERVARALAAALKDERPEGVELGPPKVRSRKKKGRPQ